LEGRDYAVIRLDESRLNISEVAGIVAGVEGRPLADVSMRLKASRGVLAENLERDVAEGMAKVLGVRGISCAVVRNEAAAAAPKPKRCTHLVVGGEGLKLKGRGFEECVGWDEVELVNCGRVRMLDHRPDRGRRGGGGAAASASIAGVSGLSAIAIGRRQYESTVSEDPYSLVIDIIARRGGGHYRLYEGMLEVILPARGEDGPGPVPRDRRLAWTILKRAGRAIFGGGLPLLAEGKSLHGYTFTSEPSYHRYTSWLLQAEKLKKEAAEGSAGDSGARGDEEREAP